MKRRRPVPEFYLNPAVVVINQILNEFRTKEFFRIEIPEIKQFTLQEAEAVLNQDSII